MKESCYFVLGPFDTKMYVLDLLLLQKQALRKMMLSKLFEVFYKFPWRRGERPK